MIRWGWRVTRIMFEAGAALLGIAFVALLLVIWRANSGPIVLDTIAPQLERLLSNPAAGTRVTIGHAQLMWNKDDQALRLVTSSLQLFDRDNHRLAEIPQLSLGLNFLAPLYGQRAPLEIFGHDLTLRLTRTVQGALRFGTETVPAVTAPEIATEPPVTLDDLRMMLRDYLQLDGGWFGFGRIGAVKLSRIALPITDQASGAEWGRLDIARITLVRQMSGTAVRGSVAARIGSTPPALIDLAADYRRGDRHIMLDATFRDFNPALWVKALGFTDAAGVVDLGLTGKVRAIFNEEMQIENAALNLHGEKGSLVWPSLWPQPLALTKLSLAAYYDVTTRQAKLTEAMIDSDGVILSLQAEAMPQSGDDSRAQVSARASIRDWPLDRVSTLWPESLAPNPRAWIVANMSAGQFREVAADVSLTTGWNQLDDIRDLKLQGKIALEKATVKYLEGMPPVTGVSGTATADQSTLTMQLTGGKAARVTLGQSPIVITGLDAQDQAISVHLTGKNSVSDVLHLLDQPPLHYTRALGLKPEQMTGQAELDVKLAFPLIKTLPLSAMQIDARAKINDFASDKLIKGLAISKGTLVLAVDASRLSVTGKASYNGAELETDYQQLFYPPVPPDTTLQSKATLRGGLDAAALTALGLPAEGKVTGVIPITLLYSKGFTSSGQLELTADLTPAALKVPMFGWEKAAQQAGAVKVKLVLDKKAVKLQNASLKGPQLDVGVSGMLDGATLEPKNLLCKPCKIARTDMQAKLDFSEGKVSEIALSGTALDYHAADSGKPNVENNPDAPLSPLKIKLDLGKFYQGSTHHFAALRGAMRRGAQGWEMIDLRAVAEGRVPITVALIPQNGLRRLSIVTDDLGDVLRAAEITDQVHEGRVRITGSSTVQQPEKIVGAIEIERYRVRKLPFLAILLNAASITGLADALGGEGITFDRLSGGFIWEKQSLTLRDVRTAGGALGLNVEGTLDFRRNQADLNGTVVPFSFFNSIIGTIPLVGDLLTGGKGGGVVAATWQAKGEIDELNINVNPVSFLAPGILRRIFFQD